MQIFVTHWFFFCPLCLILVLGGLRTLQVAASQRGTDDSRAGGFNKKAHRKILATHAIRRLLTR